MPQFEPHPTFPKELLNLNNLVAVTSPQDLDGDHLARLAMHRAENSRKRTSPDHVQNFVGTVEKPEPLAGQHAIELEVRQDTFPKQKALDLVHADLIGPQFTPQAINLLRSCQLQINASLG
jgi:hypothetical protein